jgi:hypothetical protein
MSNRLLDIVTEPDNTITNMTKEGDLTIEDLETGCEFTIRKGGTVWIKQEPQGMYNDITYGRAKVAKSVRIGRPPIRRYKMFKSKQVIYSTDCA